LGPAFAIGLPLRKFLHVPTFVIANVILDVEPFLVLYLRFDYPLHGYLHTFLSALFVGLLLGYVMFNFERFFQPLYRKLLLEPSGGLSIKSFLLSGAFGTMLHIFFDSPLYSDILPFFPLSVNPLYYPSLSTSLGIAVFSIWMGVFGIVFYSAILLLRAYKRIKKQKR